MEPARWQTEILAFLPSRLRATLASLPESVIAAVTEIRVRAGRPLSVGVAGQEVLVTPTGDPAPDAASALQVELDDVQRMLTLLTEASPYAVSERLRQGFLTLPGGHRVGVSGEARPSPEGLVLSEISGFCLRVARSLPGVAKPLLPRLVVGSQLRHTLLAGPPGAGKTTLLRDLCRLVSAGEPDTSWPGASVVVVDERGELTGSRNGVPRLDLGPRTDILVGLPKPVAIRMALRALSPKVIATDEIGSPADAAALLDALAAGVTLIATVHAGSVGEVRRREGLAPLLREGGFQVLVLLSQRGGPGTVEEVVDL